MKKESYTGNKQKKNKQPLSTVWAEVEGSTKVDNDQ